MEYFARSPFYDPTSIYGLLRMQARFNHLECSSISRRYVGPNVASAGATSGKRD